MRRSENCLNHYSPLVQMSILGGEEEEIIILTYGFTNYTTLDLKDR